MNELKKNNINLFGERGKKWVVDLPQIVETLAERWQLTEIVPVGNMSWNYVAKASSKPHSSVCLKISIDENLIADEMNSVFFAVQKQKTSASGSKLDCIAKKTF